MLHKNTEQQRKHNGKKNASLFKKEPKMAGKEYHVDESRTRDITAKAEITYGNIFKAFKTLLFFPPFNLYSCLILVCITSEMYSLNSA